LNAFDLDPPFQDSKMNSKPCPSVQIYRLANEILHLCGSAEIQWLEIAQSSFFIDISSHSAKMGLLDKAKPSVRMGRKATGL
jgi:hypothetical protein